MPIAIKKLSKCRFFQQPSDPQMIGNEYQEAMRLLEKGNPNKTSSPRLIAKG